MCSPERLWAFVRELSEEGLQTECKRFLKGHLSCGHNGGSSPKNINIVNKNRLTLAMCVERWRGYGPDSQIQR